jgi:hypothetical protein
MAHSMSRYVLKYLIDCKWLPYRKSAVVMWRQLTIRLIAFAVSAAVAFSNAEAASYSEFVSGDLPSNSATPTSLLLDPGSNTLVAEVSASDYDMLRIVVPASHRLDSITVEYHDPGNNVFAGLQSGSEWTAGIGNEIDPSLLLGWIDFPTLSHASYIGEDILDDMSLAAGAIGFLPPLPSDDYTFLFQTQASAIRFALSLNVSNASALLGDFNGDQIVTGADLATWRSAYGLTANADANGLRTDGIASNSQRRAGAE